MVGEWIGGRVEIERGTARDYGELERFHYCGGRPATWAGVWVARFVEFESSGIGSLNHRSIESLNAAQTACGASANDSMIRCSDDSIPKRVVGVAVLSHPVVCLEGREVYFGLKGMTFGQRLKWANANVRTISRVVVHPQFRGVGVASELVRCVLRQCPARYVEAVAAMGRVHPFFERAGMRRVECGGGKAYFVWGRGNE